MPFCTQCGVALKEEDNFCPRCGATARPQAAAPGEPAPVQGLVYAGVGLRFAAQLLDSLVALIFYLVVGGLLARRFGGLTPEGFQLQGAPALLLIGLTLCFWLAYFAVLEWRWGRTPGKELVGLRVVKEDGGPLDLNAAVIRNVLRLVDGFACYLVAAVFVWRSPRCQRLGDRVAHTVVVKKAALLTGGVQPR